MLKTVLKKLLKNAGKTGKFIRGLAYITEYIVGGSRMRESFLVRLLEHHYHSKFRRLWMWSETPPHFWDQRMGFFWFAFSANPRGPYSFFRGFFNSEILQNGDRLLDIGCGDGFFTKRFFSERCSHIDAIDIEPSAIEAARVNNKAPNISYHIQDAVNQPFPGGNYDVIVWDGAIGHFSANTTDIMLKKIRGALCSDGIFMGSESLGKEGDDHLQFFNSLNDLYKIFKPYFKYIELCSNRYPIGLDGAFIRQEAYWRCYNNPKHLEECQWKKYGEPYEH